MFSCSARILEKTRATKCLQGELVSPVMTKEVTGEDSRDASPLSKHFKVKLF